MNLRLRLPEMDLWKRRVVVSVVAVNVMILLSSLIYHYLMVYVEGVPAEVAHLDGLALYFHSLQVVVETFSGTGFGSDSPWETAVMNLFVSAMDLSTFLLLFVILPYVFRPVLDEVLSPDVPTDTDLTDHTVVCDYTERTEKLVGEFERRSADYVVLLDDEQQTVELLEEGVNVVAGDPSSVEGLQRANTGEAASVVVDTQDAESASVVLAVREISDDVPITVLVRDLSLEKYLRYAGATSVLTPRRLLGNRIAERIEAEIDPGVTDTASLSDGYVISEIPVKDDSPAEGKSLAEIDSLDEADVTVSALWKDGDFVASPADDTVVEAHDQLVVVGPKEAVEAAEEEIHPGMDDGGLVVVAGYGEVGSTVSEHLRRHDRACRVVDVREEEGVDVLGDATDEDVLRDAGVEEASVFVSTVQGDDTAILSVLVARELAEELDIIARVNSSGNQNKIRRAGADYVLSLPDISGRILATAVLHENVTSFDRQLRVVGVDGGEYAGKVCADLSEEGERCVVVALERGGDVMTEVPKELEFQEGDLIFVAGDDDVLDDLGRLKTLADR